MMEGNMRTGDHASYARTANEGCRDDLYCTARSEGWDGWCCIRQRTELTELVIVECYVIET
jgi:hypothetical protein